MSSIFGLGGPHGQGVNALQCDIQGQWNVFQNHSKTLVDIGRIVCNLCWKTRNWKSWTSSKKKNTMGGIALPTWKTLSSYSSQGCVVLGKVRHIGQWTGMENPDRDPHGYALPTCQRYKNKINFTGKRQSFKKWC